MEPCDCSQSTGEEDQLASSSIAAAPVTGGDVVTPTVFDDAENSILDEAENAVAAVGDEGNGIVGAEESVEAVGDEENEFAVWAPGSGGVVAPVAAGSMRLESERIVRWIHVVLPSLENFVPFVLLLIGFSIRQNLQNLFEFGIIVWVYAVMFKSNQILRQQAALKGERKVTVLTVISLFLALHVTGIFWWYRNGDFGLILLLRPPREIPQFMSAVFAIMLNDTLVRLPAMIFKCVLLMCYIDSTTRGYRKRGQLLTLMEYCIHVYRALLPTPVWYRYFAIQDYGWNFSTIITGVYLIFKLNFCFEKVRIVLAALKAVLLNEVPYGTVVRKEQVPAKKCAICYDPLKSPVILICGHIFCGDCIAEWFETKQKCPFCSRHINTSLPSFGDAATSFKFQIF